MKESHRHYEFGSLDERLEHICMLFEIDPPEIVYDKGEPTLTEPLLEWIKANEVNMDWLFAGSPCAMLREWSKARKQEKAIVEANHKLEPEVQAGMLAFLRAVVVHGVPMEEAEPLFSQVVKEFRSLPKVRAEIQEVTKAVNA